MRAYILRRLALFVPTAFGVSVFIFLMLHVIPGDYATSVLLRGRDRTIIATQADFDRIREQLGLDGSLPRQYVRWAGNFVQGDFGESWTNKRPVIDRMAPRIALSAELAFLSIVLAMIIAIPGGIIAAVKQDTWIDYTLRTLSMGFDSAPNFWLALLLIVGLLWAFDWIPPISYRTPWENPWQNFQILIFPALIIDAVFCLGGAERGLCPDCQRQRVSQAQRPVYPRFAKCDAPCHHACRLRSCDPDGRPGGDRTGLQSTGHREAADSGRRGTRLPSDSSHNHVCGGNRVGRQSGCGRALLMVRPANPVHITFGKKTDADRIKI